MDKNQKVAEFIRREVLWFFIGINVSAMLSYTFHLGDWLSTEHNWLADLFLLVCFALIAFFSKRSTKQHKS